MGRVLLLILVLLLLLSPACGLLPTSEPQPGVLPAEMDATADLAVTGRSDKGQKPPVEATRTVDSPAPAGDTEAAWTFLVYMNVAADAEVAARQALAEMNAVGSSSSVNLLVEMGLDGGGARRYRVGAEEEVDTVLPEVSLAEPGTLADFVNWGIDRYPARHYALLLWDSHGGGWEGLAPAPEGRSYLSPSELAEALSRGPRFDLVLLDAGRMAHLELLHALAPHARYAIAPPAPLPGRGVDYQQALARLYEEPTIGPEALSRLLASAATPDDVGGTGALATMTAISLDRLPAVTAALEALASTLADEPALVAPAVADARAGAEPYALLAPADEALAASVDLGHFAQRLVGRSPDPEVAGSARALQEAVTASVLAVEQGSLFSDLAQGLLVYFPPTADTYRASYGELSAFSTWQQFLSAYHALGLEAADRVDLQIVHTAGEIADLTQPAYLDFELAGRDVETLAVVAGREEEAGLRLVAYSSRLPDEKFERSRWPDGIHQGFVVWDTQARYLGDGTNGDFCLFWRPAGGRTVEAVPGQYRPGGEGPWREATLFFDGASATPAGIWVYGRNGRRGAPRLQSLAAGDLFRAYAYYGQVGGGWRPEAGVTLTVPATGTLRAETRPLPAGEYRLGLVAETMGGWQGEAFVPLTVNNPGGVATARAYLDPYRSFQFLYPAGWPTPAYEENRLHAAAPDGQTRLVVSFSEGGEPAGAAALKAQTLQQFGPVDVLYEEEIFVGGTAGLLTAYGYDTAAGGRLGLFATFVHAGTGYIVDVDGPAEREAETIALVDRLLEGWLFRPLGRGDFPGRWITATGASGPDAVPADYLFEELDNGWQRFSGEGGFIAFRHEPATNAGLEAAVKRWLDVAGGEVASFAAESLFPLSVAGSYWERADFSYEGETGTVRGFVMVTVRGGQEVLAWAEAPSADLERLERERFLPLAAEYLHAQPGEAGVLYRPAFTPGGPWGAGDLDGAEGRVKDGAYELSVAAEEGFFWATAGESFANAAVVVTATQTAGPLDNGYGLLLRADNEDGAFYLLEISGDGYVWVGRCHDSCAQVVSLTGGGWSATPAVHSGLDVPNRLRVEAVGARLTFFVNDRQIAEVTDGRLAAGDIGFFVETLGEGGVTVSFDGLRVFGH